MTGRGHSILSTLLGLFPLMTIGTKVEFWNSGTCPYAQRVWIALLEKGIDFETKKVNLQNKSYEFQATYRRANPNPLMSTKVPVLVVTKDGEDTQTYAESKVILEAMEELWPEPALLPKDPVERAKCRLFAEAVYDVALGGSRSSYQVAMRKLDSEEGKVDFDEAAERSSLCESLAALDKSLQDLCVNGGPFLLGDCFSYAECMVAPFAQRTDAMLKHYGGMNVLEICETEGYTRAAAWWKAMLERESVVASGVSPEETIQGSKWLIAMMRERQKAK